MEVKYDGRFIFGMSYCEFAMIYRIDGRLGGALLELGYDKEEES